MDAAAAGDARQLGRRVREAAGPARRDGRRRAVTLSLPVSPEIVHAGGVVCGQAILAAADTAMLVAMIAQLGEFRPMTTVQLQTSFVRPVPKETSPDRGGGPGFAPRKSLSYGDVEFRTEDGKLAAHATTTYALI